MDIEIQKNIPCPQARHGSMAGILRKMEIGDSILVPTKLANAQFTNARHIGIKIRTRKDGEGTHRIWRVS